MNIPADSDKRLIFVGGSPRSGTTLVQNMLDCHPEILGGPEFLHLPDIMALRKKLHRSIERGWIDTFCTHGEVDARLHRLCLDFLLPLADRHGVRLLSEKTPENVLVFPELAELFQEARFIHVVRDPRAIVASLLEVGSRARQKGLRPAPFAANVEAAIRRVQRSFQCGMETEQRFPQRVLTLRYEDVVQDPAGETRRMCEFLDVPWAPEMCKPGEQPHLGADAITERSNELWYDRKSYYRNPDPSSLTRWRETLKPSDQILVVQAFRNNPLLKALGYTLTLQDLPITTRILAPGAKITRLIRKRLPG